MNCRYQICTLQICKHKTRKKNTKPFANFTRKHKFFKLRDQLEYKNKINNEISKEETVNKNEILSINKKNNYDDII